MASDTAAALEAEQDLFGSTESESEMSDLDGDQGSDDELARQGRIVNSTEDRDTEAQESMNHGEQTQTETVPSLASTSAQRLPSFKRRERTKEEDEQLEQIRKQLRQKRRNEDEEGGQPESTKDPQQAIRDEVADVFAKALKSSSKKRRKRLDGDDLKDSKDEELSNLCERMKVAAETDVIANEQQKPAVAKLKMLDEVLMTLNNSSLHDSILDNQLLEAIRLWLEPLPDRALPTLEIQNELLDILDRLPAAAEHLRESGIGKVVLFYKKSTRAESVVQRKADHLVAKWTRLVLRRSESYRERQHVTQEYSKEEMLHKRKIFRPEDAAKDIDETRMHVSIPLPVAPDYDIAPRSTVRVDKARSTKNHPFKRLKTKMRSLTQSGQRKKKEE